MHTFRGTLKQTTVKCYKTYLGSKHKFLQNVFLFFRPYAMDIYIIYINFKAFPYSYPITIILYKNFGKSIFRFIHQAISLSS